MGLLLNMQTERSKGGKIMREAIYKQCVLCGCFYDIMEETGYKICPRCMEEKKVRDKNLIKKYGVKKNGK